MTTWVSHSGWAPSDEPRSGCSYSTRKYLLLRIGDAGEGFNLATSPCFFEQVTKPSCLQFLHTERRLFKNRSSLKSLPGPKPRVLGLCLPLNSFVEHTGPSTLTCWSQGPGRHRGQVCLREAGHPPSCPLRKKGYLVTMS